MADTKPTNPKDVVGSGKLPLELVPSTIDAYASLAFLEGALKYGRFNWRVAGVRASIYKAALSRHLERWWNGEDVDPATGVPHLASAIACIGIILDADVCGKLTDDRPPPAPLGDLIEQLRGRMPLLRELFDGESPHQYTIKDCSRGESPAVVRHLAPAGGHDRGGNLHRADSGAVPTAAEG